MNDSITTTFFQLGSIALGSGVIAAVLTSIATYALQIRSTRIADTAALALADTRLLEVVQLLMPPLNSGGMMESNLAVLTRRIEKFDDASIVTALRKRTDALGCVGQVQITVHRMSLMTGLEQSTEETTRHYAQVGIENALRAFTSASLREYARAIAKRAGFRSVVPDDGPAAVVLARVEENGRQSTRLLSLLIFARCYRLVMPSTERRGWRRPTSACRHAS